MFTMISLSGVRWTVLSLLLLWTRTGAHSEEVLCYVEPPGSLHPVQGLLERFKAGAGCAARESGDLETHVIAVGTAPNSPRNTLQVTVLLKPLNRAPSPIRALHLLLSSEVPLTWLLEAVGLPPTLPVLVQVSPNSSVLSRALRLNVQAVTSLPFHPHALHRWALKHLGSLSSLTHAAHADRVYVRLGEDTTLPAVCRLQSMFLSHNYLTSELQPQAVQSCAGDAAGDTGTEIHVIKLHSACSGLCSSLQVEVIVSLVPPRADSMNRTVVLILSSSVPISWAVAARGVRGHVSVHSSNSVSLSYPPEPDLTLSSTLDSDLSTMPDLLAWARQRSYTRVTSYTEADLANRFVIRLAGGVTDAVAVTTPVVMGPPWAEERRLRQWLDAGGGAGGGGDSFSVQCEDGRLSVTMDQRVLQRLPVPVTAVTLRDSTCLAKWNGTHFLLEFPVVFCGTVSLLLGQPRGVQYKNMVLLWRDEPQAVLALNETKGPLAIQFTCVAEVPTLSVPADDNDVDVNAPAGAPVPWGPEGPFPRPGMGHLLELRNGSGPVLLLKLFVDESYEHKRIGPRVVTADQRIYVEISAKGSFIDAVEVKSCVVSPLSDPKKSRFWTVISNGCSSDPSLTLSAKTKDEEMEGGGDEQKEETGEIDGLEKGRDGDVPRQLKVNRRGREPQERMDKSSVEQEIQPLKFSFILRAVYNDSLQFLHCSVRLCVSDPEKVEPAEEIVKNHCRGRLRIPPLVSRSSRHQCEIRNLLRPVVVTQPISSLAPSAGPNNKTLSVSPLPSPDLHHNMPTGPEILIIVVAFVMGVCLSGGMWCIHYYTGTRQASLGSNLTEHTHEVCNIPNPLSTSDQSASSV